MIKLSSDPVSQTNGSVVIVIKKNTGLFLLHIQGESELLGKTLRGDSTHQDKQYSIGN